MKFCPQCNNRLISNECHNWKCTEGKVVERKTPNSTWNYLYAKTKPCYKGCGGQIYFDEEYKSENDKFIPLDVVTRKPHICNTSDLELDYQGFSSDDSTKSQQYQNKFGNKITTTYHSKTSSYQNPQKIGEITNDDEKEIASLVSDIKYFDVKKIPQKDIDESQIIEEIVNGHNEGNLGIVHFEHHKTAEPEKIPISRAKEILAPSIIRGISDYGFKEGFLEYQVNAINKIIEGKNVIISAPTGSGKTEAFTIPIIQKILNENHTKGVFALLTYPLNALIDDQVSKINEIIQKCNLENKISARAIHSGIGQDARQKIIEESSKKCIILATSFDFIDWHLTLQTNSWKLLCQPAKMIVMDEAHSYTSFHGSNVHHVIKRMRKYMKNVQYVCASATLENPEEFFKEMFEVDTSSFDNIKSAIGRKQDIYRLFIMPRKLPQRETMEMISSICHKNNAKQIVFSNTVNDAEVIAVNLRERNPGIRTKVHSGVIEKGDRRIAEVEIKQGDLDVLSCTPTLELGIDIGQVNVAISAFTGEFDKMIQRTGRAGRRGQKSYAICVFEPRDAVCHYYANNIKEYTGQRHQVYINKDNPIISQKHEKSKEIEEIALKTFDKKPLWKFANNMNLRGTSGFIKIYVPGNKTPLEKGIPTGYYQLYEHSLYRLNSVLYEVDRFEKTENDDNHGGKAFLKNCSIIDRNRKTLPIVKTSLGQVKKTEDRLLVAKNNHKIQLTYCIVNIEKRITGYYKGSKNDNIQTMKKIKGITHHNWKDLVWDSKHSAVKIQIPTNLYSQEDAKSVHSNEKYNNEISEEFTHTITHVFLNAAKIITKCDDSDVDVFFDDGDNCLYIYDNSANGANGCSKIIYKYFENVLQKAYLLISKCSCKKGCPKCIHISGFCKTNNQDLEKQKTLRFFRELLE